MSGLVNSVFFIIVLLPAVVPAPQQEYYDVWSCDSNIEVEQYFNEANTVRVNVTNCLEKLRYISLSSYPSPNRIGRKVVIFNNQISSNIVVLGTYNNIIAVIKGQQKGVLVFESGWQSTTMHEAENEVKKRDLLRFTITQPEIQKKYFSSDSQQESLYFFKSKYIYDVKINNDSPMRVLYLHLLSTPNDENTLLKFINPTENRLKVVIKNKYALNLVPNSMIYLKYKNTWKSVVENL